MKTAVKKIALTCAFVIITVYSVVLTFHYKIPQKMLGSLIGTTSKTVPANKNYDYLNNIVYRELVSQYPYYSNIGCEIVMLGDSITYRVNWNELLGRIDVINRGIGSDTAIGLLERLDNVIRLKPKKVFIMIGINDLSIGFTPRETFENYIKIIVKLESNNIEPVIQSTLYVRDNVEINEDVSVLNSMLIEYCRDKKYTYIDLNRILSESKKLKSEYTIDGVHLLGKAYSLWKEEVIKYIE